MVLYGESQWAKAKIHQHVSMGIKIQWVEDGAATQLIETEEVDVQIRAMNGEDKEEYPVRVVVPRSGKSNKVSKDFVIPSNKASKDFVIPSDWRTISTKRRSGPWLNHKLKDKKYVSPDNKSFRSLVAVERYLTGTNTVQEWSQYLMSSSSSSSSSEEDEEDDDDEQDEADIDVTSAPSSSLSSVTNGVPRRIYKLGDCRKCAAGSGKRDGHKGKHAFKLPRGWTTEIRTGNGPTDDGGKYKHYISPEGEVFSSVPAVERYLESISTSGGGAISGNGSPSSSQSSTSSMINNTVALPIRKEGECKKCMAGSGNLNGHRGLHKLNKEQMQQQIKRKKQQEKQQKKEQLRKEQERQEDIEQKRLQRNQRISARDSPTSSSSSSSSTVTSHLHSGNTVMVSYGEVGSIQWAKATILHQVNTGIKIQWIDGGATQLINHIDVNNRIREMTEDDMQERDEDDGEDGYEVENQEKDAEDHKDSPVAFQLPSGWSVQKKKGWKSYINPDGDKRFNSMAAVERHINGEPSKLTTSSSSSSSTPSSETTSNAIHQIIEHFKTCTHNNSNSNGNPISNLIQSFNNESIDEWDVSNTDGPYYCKTPITCHTTKDVLQLLKHQSHLVNEEKKKEYLQCPACQTIFCKTIDITKENGRNVPIFKIRKHFMQDCKQNIGDNFSGGNIQKKEQFALEFPRMMLLDSLGVHFNNGAFEVSAASSKAVTWKGPSTFNTVPSLLNHLFHKTLKEKKENNHILYLKKRKMKKIKKKKKNNTTSKNKKKKRKKKSNKKSNKTHIKTKPKISKKSVDKTVPSNTITLVIRTTNIHHGNSGSTIDQGKYFIAKRASIA